MRRFPIVLLASCGLLLVACGGDDDDDASGGDGSGDFCTNMAEIDKLMGSESESDVSKGVELMRDTAPPADISDDWETVVGAAESLLSDDASAEEIAAAQEDLRDAGGRVGDYVDKNCD